MFRNFRKYLVAVGIVLTLVATSLSQDGPLTYPSILTALSAKPPAEMTRQHLIANLIADVKYRGVDKPLTPDIEGLLRQAGASSSLIDAIRDNSPLEEAVRLRSRFVLRMVHSTGARTLSARAKDLSHTVDVIKGRLQVLGVRGTVVRPLNPENDLIEVKIPVVDDHELVKWLIHIPGRIKLVHLLNPLSSSIMDPFPTYEKAVAFAVKSKLKRNHILPNYSCYGRSINNSPSEFYCPSQPEGWFVAANQPLAEGHDCLSFNYRPIRNNVWHLECNVKKISVDRLNDWMSSNKGEYIGTALDGRVSNFAYIKSPAGERWGIYVQTSKAGVSALSRVLVAEPLPVDVHLEYVSEETIDEVHHLR